MVPSATYICSLSIMIFKTPVTEENTYILPLTTVLLSYLASWDMFSSGPSHPTNTVPSALSLSIFKLTFNCLWPLVCIIFALSLSSWHSGVHHPLTTHTNHMAVSATFFFLITQLDVTDCLVEHLSLVKSQHVNMICFNHTLSLAIVLALFGSKIVKWM